MKTLEYTEKTGKIKTYHLENEIENLLKNGNNKPSSRLIKTRKGKKAIKALKELEENHNHSWYEELKKRASKNPQALALFYRGTKITFKELFRKADELANSLSMSGIEYGDEIPCCLANTPEMVYLLLAANKLGAKLNLFGAHFAKDYLHEILDGCSNKVIFISDDVYGELKDVIDKREFNSKVIISLADSLPLDPSSCDEYEQDLDEYYHYDNKAKIYREADNSLNTFDEFLEKGKNYNVKGNGVGTLDTDALVTYTSGSTKIGHPSQIVHTNRSLITCGRFHDAELSGNPELTGLRGLAHIHTESNTDVITCISDNLMQLWAVALEPEYDKRKALDYIILNKPNYLNITSSFLIQAAKDYLIDKRFNKDGKSRKLPFLFTCFAVGEGLSKGEEKFINKFLRKTRAGSGVKIAGMSLPFTTVCVGGGDCEHGGIYYTLWKSLYEKLYGFRLKKKEYGLMPVPYAIVSAFKKNDDDVYEECNFNEYGIIAGNSATTTVGYKNDGEKTKKLIIRDVNGQDWITANVYGYIDELGGVHVKSRLGNEIILSDGRMVPAFVIEDLVCQDTKNVLSCSVTSSELNGTKVPILNIEFQYDKKMSDEKVIQSILERCAKSLGNIVYNDFNFRIIDHKTSYHLTGSGKRSIPALEAMDLDGVVKFNNGELLNIQETLVNEEEKLIYKNK